MPATKPKDEDLQPTPPVGWPIQWFEGGPPGSVVEGQTCSAETAAIEEAGRIEVWVKPPNGQQLFWRRGVRHVSDPIWEAGRPGDSQNGAWDYIPGLVNNDRYEKAQEEALRRKRQREAAVERQKENERKKQERIERLQKAKEAEALKA